MKTIDSCSKKNRAMKRRPVIHVVRRTGDLTALKPVAASRVMFCGKLPCREPKLCSVVNFPAGSPASQWQDCQFNLLATLRPIHTTYITQRKVCATQRSIIRISSFFSRNATQVSHATQCKDLKQARLFPPHARRWPIGNVD